MFVEDLSAFFADFGVDATLGSATIRVIFDSDYLAALGGFIESTGPQALAQSADLVGKVQGDPITINAVAYKIATVKPDGTGLTSLALELA